MVGTHWLLDSWTHFFILLQVDLCMTRSSEAGVAHGSWHRWRAGGDCYRISCFLLPPPPHLMWPLSPCSSATAPEARTAPRTLALQNLRHMCTRHPLECYTEQTRRRGGHRGGCAHSPRRSLPPLLKEKGHRNIQFVAGQSWIVPGIGFVLSIKNKQVCFQKPSEGHGQSGFHLVSLKSHNSGEGQNHEETDRSTLKDGKGNFFSLPE